MNENDVIAVGRSTWAEDLDLGLSPAEIASIPAPDREALFAGMIQFLSSRDDVEIIRVDEDSQLAKGASAPLLVPRTRVFIRFGDSFRDWYKKVIRMAAMLVIVGNVSPFAAFVGLSVDLALAVYEKFSLLDPIDTTVVSTILEMMNASDASLPSTTEIAKRLPESCDVDGRLTSLQARGIIRQQEQGWSVVF